MQLLPRAAAGCLWRTWHKNNALGWRADGRAGVVVFRGMRWRVVVRGSRVAAVIGGGKWQLGGAQGGEGVVLFAKEWWYKGAVHFPLKCFCGAENEKGEKARGHAGQVAGDGGHGTRMREIGASFVDAFEDVFAIFDARRYVCPFEYAGEKKISYGAFWSDSLRETARKVEGSASRRRQSKELLGSGAGAYQSVAKAMASRITSQLSKVARGCEPEYARLRLNLAAVLFDPVLAVVAEAALPYSRVNHV